MWQLLKAEYTYWRTGLGILLVLYCSLLIVVFRWGWESVERDLAGMTNIGLIGLIIFISVRVAIQRGDRTERLHALLPLRARQGDHTGDESTGEKDPTDSPEDDRRVLAVIAYLSAGR